MLQNLYFLKQIMQCQLREVSSPMGVLNHNARRPRPAIGCLILAPSFSRCSSQGVSRRLPSVRPRLCYAPGPANSTSFSSPPVATIELLETASRFACLVYVPATVCLHWIRCDYQTFSIWTSKRNVV